MQFERVDLATIRAEAVAIYAEWDTAVARSDIRAATKIRQKQLWPLIRSHAGSVVFELPGIYLFASNSGRVGWHAITYIGRAERPLRSRFEDYVKDDSCWDVGLLGATVETVTNVMFKRVRPTTTMNRTSDGQILSYGPKHYRAIQRTKGCSLFVVGFSEADLKMIRPVESALIALGFAHGAPIENERVEPLPPLAERSDIFDYCARIVEGWKGRGMHNETASAILASISTAKP